MFQAVRLAENKQFINKLMELLERSTSSENAIEEEEVTLEDVERSLNRRNVANSGFKALEHKRSNVRTCFFLAINCF